MVVIRVDYSRIIYYLIPHNQCFSKRHPNLINMRLYPLFFLAFLLSTNTMAQPDYYHLEIESENVEFRCFINGLPVYQSNDENESTVSLPVQLYLIGKDK